MVLPIPNFGSFRIGPKILQQTNIWTDKKTFLFLIYKFMNLELVKAYGEQLIWNEYFIRYRVQECLTEQQVSPVIDSQNLIQPKVEENLIQPKTEDPTNFEHPGFKCQTCEKLFKRESHLNQHMKVHDNKQWECDVCKKTFTTKYFLKKHKRLHTG